MLSLLTIFGTERVKRISKLKNLSTADLDRIESSTGSTESDIEQLSILNENQSKRSNF